MSKEISLKQAKCTSLELSVPVEFASEDGEQGKFRMIAYTGAVVERWWGKLAINVDGIKSKKKMPIFQQHEHTAIAGYSEKAWKEDGKFIVEGRFSGVTAVAAEVAALAKEGFPWQASIGVNPKKVLFVEEKSEHEVNGIKLKGPAEVWLESEVYEVSFVPLGADSGTSVSTFSRFDEQSAPKHEEKKAMNREDLEKEHPDIVAQIKAEALALGKEQERTRIKGVREQLMPGHEALIESLANDGVTTGEQAAVKVLQAEKSIRANVSASLKDDAVKPVAHVVPPVTETLAEDKTLPIDERIKAQWDKDGALRGEFSGDYEAFSAYFKANERGQVKVLKNKEAK